MGPAGSLGGILWHLEQTLHNKPLSLLLTTLRPTNHHRDTMEDKRDVQISKALSYLLRHGAEKEHLAMDAQGYVLLGDLLRNNRLKSHRATAEDVARVVQNNNKKRFTLVTRDDGQQYVCANQGHSLKKVSNDNLQLLEQSREAYPAQLIHGTTRQKLRLILASGGLSRMGRNHIHFTSVQVSHDEHVSGLRTFSDVLIFVDIDKLLRQDSIRFYKSLNDVYLTEGDASGMLPVLFFLKIVDRKTGEPIAF